MREIEFMGPSERIIGITIPENQAFYVLNHDEILKVEISDTLEFKLTDMDPYKFIEESNSFIGIEVSDTGPILSVGDKAVSYSFAPADDYVKVTCNISEKIETITFPILSGDWFFATLSKDGRYLVLAEPYELAVYDLQDGIRCLQQKNKSERSLIMKLYAYIRRIIMR